MMIDQEKRPEELSLEQLLVRCGHHAAHRSAKGRGRGRVLEVLSASSFMNQGDLLEALGIQAGSLSELLSRMEEQGLIEREKDEEDRRRSVIHITDAGRALLAGDEQEDLFSCLTEEEKAQLTSLLRKLKERWDLDRPALPAGERRFGRRPFQPPRPAGPGPDPHRAELPVIRPKKEMK